MYQSHFAPFLTRLELVLQLKDALVSAENHDLEVVSWRLNLFEFLILDDNQLLFIAIDRGLQLSHCSKLDALDDQRLGAIGRIDSLVKHMYAASGISHVEQTILIKEQIGRDFNLIFDLINTLNLLSTSLCIQCDLDAMDLLLSTSTLRPYNRFRPSTKAHNSSDASVLHIDLMRIGLELGHFLIQVDRSYVAGIIDDQAMLAVFVEMEFGCFYVVLKDSLFVGFLWVLGILETLFLVFGVWSSSLWYFKEF